MHFRFFFFWFQCEHEVKALNSFLLKWAGFALPDLGGRIVIEKMKATVTATFRPSRQVTGAISCDKSVKIFTSESDVCYSEEWDVEKEEQEKL